MVIQHHQQRIVKDAAELYASSEQCYVIYSIDQNLRSPGSFLLMNKEHTTPKHLADYVVTISYHH